MSRGREVPVCYPVPVIHFLEFFVLSSVNDMYVYILMDIYRVMGVELYMYIYFHTYTYVFIGIYILVSIYIHKMDTASINNKRGTTHEEVC